MMPFGNYKVRKFSAVIFGPGIFGGLIFYPIRPSLSFRIGSTFPPPSPTPGQNKTPVYVP